MLTVYGVETLVKQGNKKNKIPLYVATALTVYGIETNNSGAVNASII